MFDLLLLEFNNISFCMKSSFFYLMCSNDACQAVRAGLNVEIAPDLIANQLNVRKGALILQVLSNKLISTKEESGDITFCAMF